MTKNRQDLKQAAVEAVDRLAPAIFRTGEFLFENPELGYKEAKATAHVAGVLKDAGYEIQQDIAVTGVRAQVSEKKPGPTLALMGELDAIVCKDHPQAGPDGAVHACGHHIQVAVMAGIAMALQKTNAFSLLGGNVVFMAVPAEEFVEIEFRSDLKDKGIIRYFGGKQEMVSRGLFDAIDISVMMHAMNLEPDKKVMISPTSNGFIGKKISFSGRESHAGSAPENGVNALNAAMLAMNNIHAQRETFSDHDRIRVHPIITKGGDMVNVVPADVRMECYVRGRTVDSICRANAKVDRAVKAGAMAVGAGVEIQDMPGYLPLVAEPGLDTLFTENVTLLSGKDVIVQGGDFTGSFDFGDISHLMPALHPFIGGVKGNLHTKNFRVTNPETAFLLPAKALAMTIVDLLWNNGEAAEKILSNFNPTMSKDQYMAWLKKTEHKTVIPLAGRITSK